MKSDGIVTSTRRILELTPGSSIAVIGLALALFTLEAHRMSSFQVVAFSNSLSNLSSIIAFSLFVLFALSIYRIRPSFRLHRYALVGFIISGAYAASIFILSHQFFGAPNEPMEFIASILQRLCQMLILLCWAESLIPLGARKVAVLVSLAFFVLALLNSLTVFFRVDAAVVTVAIAPMISMACLYWFKDHGASMESIDPEAKANAYSLFHVDQSLMPFVVSPKTLIGLYLVFFSSLLFYPVIFGFIHYSWIPSQDGSFVSMAVQLAAAAGTLVAGIILMVLTTMFWGKRKIQLYPLIILPIIILALYLSSILDASYAFIYVVPLNIAQKITLFLIWVTPFLIPSKKSPLFVWAAGYSLYQVGRIIAGAASNVPDSFLHTLFVVIAIILLITGIFIGVLLDKGRKAPLSPGQISEANDAVSDRIRASVGVNSMHDPSEHAEKRENPHNITERCHDIALGYRLTRREEEVLQLLAEGMNAQSIAETLIVSTATAKSHMRNIYSKLEIHTQSELIIIIHKH